jgi:hypothetical protein
MSCLFVEVFPLCLAAAYEPTLATGLFAMASLCNPGSAPSALSCQGAATALFCSHRSARALRPDSGDSDTTWNGGEGLGGREREPEGGGDRAKQMRCCYLLGDTGPSE